MLRKNTSPFLISQLHSNDILYNKGNLVLFSVLSLLLNLSEGHTKLTRNKISCIFQLHCKANAANSKWNSVFIRSVRWESVVEWPLAVFNALFKSGLSHTTVYINSLIAGCAGCMTKMLIECSFFISHINLKLWIEFHLFPM